MLHLLVQLLYLLLRLLLNAHQLGKRLVRIHFVLMADLRGYPQFLRSGVGPQEPLRSLESVPSLGRSEV